MTRNYSDYFSDMYDAVCSAENFISSMEYDDFVRDSKTIYAVVRALEIIGEASSNIPDEIRKKYPALPWSQMKGMRNKLIHEYFGVNVKVIWKTVKEDLPPLKEILNKILSS